MNGTITYIKEEHPSRDNDKESRQNLRSIANNECTTLGKVNSNKIDLTFSINASIKSLSLIIGM